MSTIRVALIEDHDIVRIGLRSVLQRQVGIEVVGEANNGIEGLTLLQTTQIDVALVDIGLPGIDGIELTQQFRQFQQQQPELMTKILMLTMQENEVTVLASFAAGADSYCMKDIGSEHLVEAIRSTHSGHAWIDPAIANIVLQQLRQNMLIPAPSSEYMIEIRSVGSEYARVLASDPVTEREREVLELMVAGCTNAIIADRLFITVGTVKTHIRNILAKLCANDRTEAAVRALRSGIIS
jgi:two-component system, NarL family, response regulator LiaR